MAKTACLSRTMRPPSLPPSANCSTTRNRRAKSAPPRAAPSWSDLPWAAWSPARSKLTTGYSPDYPNAYPRKPAPPRHTGSGDSVIASFLALIFGLLIGSFLNVCIHRWPRNRSVVKPRSHCVRCRNPIAWYDNIPLVSYLVLGGRCRHCGARISLRYPVVEVLTAMLFFYQVSMLGPTLAALKMCVFCALAVALIFCDLEKRILPDEFTVGGIALGLISSAFVPMAEPNFFAMFYSMATRSELPHW